MRSTWKGALVVGKVSIPIDLFLSAEHVDDISFRSLHLDCGTPITTQRRCPACDVGDGSEGGLETTQGFEFAEGQFVKIDREEISKAIAGDQLVLDRFIPSVLIKAAMIDTTYLVGPSKDPAAAHAYDALLGALEKTSLVGLGRIGMSTRERIAAVWPIDVDGAGQLIGLTTLYPVEALRVDDAATIHDRIEALGALAATSEEVELFAELLETRSAAATFRWRAVKRFYPSRIRELVEQKRAGGEIVVAPTVVATAPLDLRDALTKSVKATRRKTAAAR